MFFIVSSAIVSQLIRVRGKKFWKDSKILESRSGNMNPRAVAQTSKSAVSRVSKPADRPPMQRARFHSAPPIGKSATQQVWKPALRRWASSWKVA